MRCWSANWKLHSAAKWVTTAGGGGSNPSSDTALRVSLSGSLKALIKRRHIANTPAHLLLQQVLVGQPCRLLAVEMHDESA